MAGGLGTRMKSSVPKHLHPLLGRRVVDWVLETARATGADPIVVVASPDTRDAYDDDVVVALQEEARGTGDAVVSAQPALDGFGGSVLVLDAAAPLVTTGLLEQFVAQHQAGSAAVTILTIEPDERLPYGRIVRAEDDSVSAIVEERDANDEQRAIRELNSSIYVFDAQALRDALGKLDARNAQGELYLTDTIAHIVAAGGRAEALRADDATEAIGINNRAELAAAAALLRDRINEAHMLNGVTIVDPATTWIDASVQLEPEVVIHPFTVLRGATRVAAGAEIGPHAVAVDALIGERVSIAAGNITVNFPHEPGLPKGRTTIGKNVRTGVQNAFVAPVEIGDEAWIAAGSVITKNVPPGALAVARARQENKEGRAGRKRDD
jgi:bifunctional UDP-N-acetylglucosamine pyrophosphorylase/glucosamine-1-phosphate N-acetyltransferase